jgi:acylglycerol lipase
MRCRPVLMAAGLCFLLAGCATSRPCLEPMPEVSTTGAVTRTPYRVEAAGQQCLQAYEWRSRAPVRGIVVVVHGLRDHAVRYDGLAQALAAQGFAVYAQDLRGHGRSGGARQRFDSMAELLSDVDLTVAEAKRRTPGVPVFLYGHSLGGLIVTSYGLTRPDGAAGLVLSGPALKLFPTVTGGEKAGARLFGALIPGLKVQQLDDTTFVREAEAKRQLAADPLVTHENLPARSAAASLDAIDVIQARMGELKVPFLVMHGTGDTATNPEGSRELAEKAAVTDKTFKAWEGLFHDLLHEPEQQQVIDLTVGWLIAHLPT